MAIWKMLGTCIQGLALFVGCVAVLHAAQFFHVSALEAGFALLTTVIFMMLDYTTFRNGHHTNLLLAKLDTVVDQLSDRNNF